MAVGGRGAAAVGTVAGRRDGLGGVAGDGVFVGAMVGAAVGQACVLQSCSSVRLGHFMPPFWGSTVTLRLRVWLPPPHFASHLDHAPHSDTSQFTTAHWWVPGGQVVVPAMKSKQLVSLSCWHGPEDLPKQPRH